MYIYIYIYEYSIQVYERNENKRRAVPNAHKYLSMRYYNIIHFYLVPGQREGRTGGSCVRMVPCGECATRTEIII